MSRGLDRFPQDVPPGHVTCSTYCRHDCVMHPIPTRIPSHAEFFSQGSNLPSPVILHIAAPRGIADGSVNATLVEFLSANTPLSRDFLRELCNFGAVYARVGHPGPAVSPKPPRIAISSLDIPIPCNVPVYARVHVTPRRHRSLWPMRIVYDDDDLVVVSKPAGIPSIPTIDNLRECAITMAENLVAKPSEFQKPLRVTSRLDVGTSGLLVLARTQSAVKIFNNALCDRLVQKTYAVLSRIPPKQGCMRHWIKKNAPLGQGSWTYDIVRPCTGVDSDDHDLGDSVGADWSLAELIVESVKPVHQGRGWESAVRLVTGKTHQIRLQFAAEGCHVWGCTKYEKVGGEGFIDAGGILGDNSEKHGIHCSALDFPCNGKRVVLRDERSWWRESLD